MSDKMSKAEQLLMWGLFAAGGARLLKDIVPKPAKGAHSALGRRGFLANTPQGRTRLLELTDQGWRWIVDSDPFPIGEDEKRISTERRLLQALTRSIKRNAAAQGVELSQLFSIEAQTPAEHVGKRLKPEATRRNRSEKRSSTKTSSTTPLLGDAAPSSTTQHDVAAEIRDACHSLAGRPQRDGVRLSALRARLGHIKPSELDAALLAMREAGDANLMNLDNPRDLAEEKGAELRSGSQAFHIIWIER